MTLNHVQGHPYCESFKCDFTYSCAAVDKISTDSAWRGRSAVAELLDLRRVRKGQQILVLVLLLLLLLLIIIIIISRHTFSSG